MKDIIKVFKYLFIAAAIMLIMCACTKGTQAYIEDFTEETTEPTTEQTTQELIYNAKITAVGDLMVHSWQMDDAYKGKDTYDFNYCFEPVLKYLNSADITVGNLETVIGGKEIGYSDYPCFNSPSEFLDALLNAGFDMFTTANNHCMDKKKNGLLNTINELDKRGFMHFGTYASESESNKVLVKEINNIKFAFVSMTYGTNGITIPYDSPYLVNIMSEELIKEKMKRAREENPDFIVVMPHMGNEYEEYPRDVFKNWVDILIKEGADIILASHPHVLQPIEYRTVTCEDNTTKTAFVAYSLANFISSQRTKPRDAGMILNLEFEKVGDKKAVLKQADFIPTWVQWRDTSGEYNIRVLSVFDALNSAKTDNKFKLRNNDIQRLKEVQAHSTKIVTGTEITADNMAERYVINK